MKKHILLFIMTAGALLTSCNVNGGSSKLGNESSTQAVAEQTENSNDSLNPTTTTLPNVNGNSAGLNPIVVDTSTPPSGKQLSETDKMLVNYNEEFLKMVQSKQEGKQIDPESSKRFDEIQKKLQELEKAGKLNDNQKQLLKVTKDAYNTFKQK